MRGKHGAGGGVAVGEELLFKLDDSSTPGWARVKLLGEARPVGPGRVYRVEVIGVLRPDVDGRSPKLGSKRTVAARNLAGERLLFREEEVAL